MPSITEEVAELRSKMVSLEPFMSPIPKMMPLVPVMCSSVPIRLSSEASRVGLAVCLVRALCPAERLGYSLSDIEICLPEKPWSKRPSGPRCLYPCGRHAFVVEPVAAAGHKS